MDTAPQSIVRQPSRSRPATDDRRCIALFVPGCRAALLRARDPTTLGSRRVASRGCSERGACGGVGLAFAGPLRTRPISSAISGSTQRSRASPRTDGSP